MAGAKVVEGVEQPTHCVKNDGFDTKGHTSHIKSASTTNTTDPPRTHLLGLPAELRNAIWGLCLVHDSHIPVEKDSKPPALLSINRQIREETVQIWHGSKIFFTDVEDCDSALLQAYVRNVLQPIGMQKRWKLDIDFKGVDWDNLVGYCRAVWEGILPRLHFDDDADDIWAVIYAATKVAQADLSWQEVESHLEGLRVLAVRLNEEWAIKGER